MYEELNYVNGHKFPTESPVKDGEFMELKRQRFFFLNRITLRVFRGGGLRALSVDYSHSLFHHPTPIPLHYREFSTYTDGR